MSIYIAHRRRKKLLMCWTQWCFANKNVFNERLKDSSLHVGSRRSADSEFQVVGPATAKDRRPRELSWSRGTRNCLFVFGIKFHKHFVNLASLFPIHLLIHFYMCSTLSIPYSYYLTLAISSTNNPIIIMINGFTL